MINELKWIAWESTRKCNLNCIHCRSKSNAECGEKIGTEKAHELMKKISRVAKPVFVLSGGEPLLREDIFELATYGNSLGFRMAMATNGTLIDDEICKNIKNSGIKIVSISIDGSIAEIHDKFRKQSGAFEKIMNGIEFLKKNGIEFIINSSFSKVNQNDIKNCYKLARKVGARAWYMFIIVPMGRGREIIDELINREDYEEILRWHYRMEQEEKEMLVRPTCAPSYYRIYNEERVKNSGVRRRNLTFSPNGSKGCVAAQSIAYINYEGDIFPCSYFTESGGNIFKNSLEEIWNSSLFKSFREISKYRGYCGECKYGKICGGCRARALIYNNDHLGNDPYCDYRGN